MGLFEVLDEFADDIGTSVRRQEWQFVEEVISMLVGHDDAPAMPRRMAGVSSFLGERSHERLGKSRELDPQTLNSFQTRWRCAGRLAPLLE